MRTSCPCGRRGNFGEALPYDRCCGRYLDDPNTPAPDPTALMRSRYTAYVTGRRDYLLATWDAATRPRDLRLDPGMVWDGLEVLDHGDTAPNTAPGGAGAGEVEFVAHFRPAGGLPGRLHERSRFTCRGGRWFYVDGDVH